MILPGTTAFSILEVSAQMEINRETVHCCPSPEWQVPLPGAGHSGVPQGKCVLDMELSGEGTVGRGEICMPSGKTNRSAGSLQ